MKGRKLLLFCIIVYIFAPLWMSNVYASSKDDGILGETVADFEKVHINEIMPDPEGSDTDGEWVELYNASEESVDLSSCTLDGNIFENGATLGGQQYGIVARDVLDKDADGESFEIQWGNASGVWGDDVSENFSILEMNLSLKNSADSLTLSCGDYEDIVAWEETFSGQSLSLDEGGIWTDQYLVTPGYQNQPQEKVVYSHSIIITEVYPSARTDQDEEEWLELYNFSDEVISLEGWQLEDNSKRQTFTKEQFIGGNSYYVVDSEFLTLTLNNSGEALKLYDPGGEIVDIFEYQDTQKGVSNIRLWNGASYDQEVIQSQVASKGEENVFVSLEDVFYGVEMMAISDLREGELGVTVATEGVVTVEVDILGSKLFYVQDATGGIQVYISDEAFWGDVLVGDRIKVRGELREKQEEMRIYVKDEHALTKVYPNEGVTSFDIKTGEIGERWEGACVFLSGEIIKTSGKTFFIDDGSGPVKVTIKSSTGIETPGKKRGQFAGVTGIVSQYGEDDEGNPSYRILPRYREDIIISDVPVQKGYFLAATGGSIKGVVIIGLVFMWRGISFYIVEDSKRIRFRRV